MAASHTPVLQLPVGGIVQVPVKVELRFDLTLPADTPNDVIVATIATQLSWSANLAAGFKGMNVATGIVGGGAGAVFPKA